MQTIIQPAKIQHLDELVALLKLLFSKEADFDFAPVKHTKALKQIIEDEHCGCYVALQNRKVIGMCTAQWVFSTATGEKSAWLEDLVVTDQSQGQGIGKKLLTAIEDWATQQGCNRVQLVYDLHNQPAISFYQKRGFQTTQLGVFSKPIKT